MSRGFVLDSNVCIDILRGNARVIENVKLETAHGVGAPLWTHAP
jgi:predicted nucleic acid-binding protein